MFKFNIVSLEKIKESRGGNDMIELIDYDGGRNILFKGVAGSGKTTVNVLRAARLFAKRKNVLFLTRQKLLRISIQNILSHSLSKGKLENISTVHSWYANATGKSIDNATKEEVVNALKENSIYYDEILIDEGQDLSKHIYKALGKVTPKLCVGADNSQKLYQNGANIHQIIQMLKDHSKLKQKELQYNYRNTYEIYRFAMQFLPDLRANNKRILEDINKHGDLPEIFIVGSDKDRKQRLLTLLESNRVNTGVLFYNWKSVANFFKYLRESVEADETDLNLDDFCMYHSYLSETAKSKIEKNMKRIVLTTFFSAKGLEFQMVIIPLFDKMNDQMLNHMYVACTRATQNLYLFSEKGKLPDILEKFAEDSYKVI